MEQFILVVVKIIFFINLLTLFFESLIKLRDSLKKLKNHPDCNQSDK